MRIQYFIGIDPGVTGGIAALDAETGELTLYDIPLIGNKEIDARGLFEIFEKYTKERHIFCLEDVHAIAGSAAGNTFKFGKMAGLKEGFLIASKAEFQKVAPKKWQAVAWQGIPNMLNSKGARDTKGMSLLAAQRLFPNQKFLKSKTGPIDAALMAKYMWLTYGQVKDNNHSQTN